MKTPDWQQLVLVFSIVCHVVLLWRLWAQKLARVYLYLTAFLVGETFQSIVVLPVSPRSVLYEGIFLWSTPFLWILAYLVVLELYRLVLEDYPGIASAGRKGVSWCMGVAIVISFVYAIPDLRTQAGAFSVMRTYVIFERSIVLGLLVFLVLIQLFLFRYRLRLSPNRMVYATGYAVYFALVAAWDAVITSLGLHIVASFNLGIVVISDVILLAGAALLSQAGEVKPQLEAVDSSADRARLQQQLADINRMLSRAARSRG